VLGVVENYHYQSLQHKVLPVAFGVAQPATRLGADNLIVRLNTEEAVTGILGFEKVWKRFSDDEYFSFHFVDATYQAIYMSERRFLSLFTIFAGLSIFISCMGLSGVVLFTTESRSKEISIRKVLGSSVAQIVLMVARRFLLLILLGFVLGIPTALYFAANWLAQFPYRIGVDVLTVVLAALLVLAVAILTIGTNTIKAALANPVKHLRND